VLGLSADEDAQEAGSKVNEEESGVQEEAVAAAAAASEPLVAVARLQADGRLYAVERVGRHVYAMCRLAAWVGPELLRGLARSEPREGHAIVAAAIAGQVKKHRGDCWWQAAAVDLKMKDDEKVEQEGRTRVAMMRKDGLQQRRQSQPSRPATEDESKAVANVPSTGLNEAPAPPPANEKIPTGEPAAAAAAAADAQQLFDALVVQYLEALYLSRTSLAYFVKGPLSRARAAFTSSSAQDPSLQPYDLAMQLRAMLLTASATDKKYKTKLPAILKDAHLDGDGGAASDGEGGGGAAAATPWKPTPALLRGKSKKLRLRLGGEGMYKREEEFARRWWRFHDGGAAVLDAEETLDAAVRRRVAELRVRETLAQIVLVLEVMALEGLATYRVPEEVRGEEPVGEARMQDEGEGEPVAKPKKKRQKKPQDLKLLLDLLLDKLCIWQSVEQDEFIAPESKADHQMTANSVKASNGDGLRDFCTEVIIPL
jgi:DNA replication regulator SLD3